LSAVVDFVCVICLTSVLQDKYLLGFPNSLQVFRSTEHDSQYHKLTACICHV